MKKNVQILSQRYVMEKKGIKLLLYITLKKQHETTQKKEDRYTKVPEKMG